LFKNEDSDDLATKLEKFLSEDTYNINPREIIEKEFSWEKHIKAIKDRIDNVVNLNNKQIIDYELIDEEMNDGVFFSDNNNGFFYKDIDNDGNVKMCNANNELISENEHFLCYRYYIEKSIEKISCNIKVFPYSTCNVFLQCDFYDKQNNLISMDGSGRFVSENNDTISLAKNIPEIIIGQGGYADIIIRPNPNEHIKVKKLIIKAWKSKNEQQ